MSADGWNRVSHNAPCPICGKPDNCTVSTDGRMVWCGRVSDGSLKQNNGGQFLHCLDNASDWSPSAPIRSRERKHEPPKDYSGLAKKWFCRAELRRAELAQLLGVDANALHALQVGYCNSEDCWTIPERDAAGTVIGIRRRFRDGAKKVVRGHKAGLTYCDGWSEYPGPILLSEGASDVAAGISMRLAIVGRPSNLGGVPMLGELLAGVSAQREIVVIGELDRKSQEELKPKVRKNHDRQCSGCSSCWPGKYGAIRTASQLAETLRRPIDWSFPPNDAKDVREWLQSKSGDRR